MFPVPGTRKKTHPGFQGGFFVSTFEVAEHRLICQLTIPIEIGNLVMSRRRKLSREERERIVRVVKALIAT